MLRQSNHFFKGHIQRYCYKIKTVKQIQNVTKLLSKCGKFSFMFHQHIWKYHQKNHMNVIS